METFKEQCLLSTLMNTCTLMILNYGSYCFRGKYFGFIVNQTKVIN